MGPMNEGNAFEAASFTKTLPIKFISAVRWDPNMKPNGICCDPNSLPSPVHLANAVTTEPSAAQSISQISDSLR